MIMEKYIKEGNVAVLVSPGHGAGWSTWVRDMDDPEGAIFDVTLVKHFLCEEVLSEEQLEAYLTDKYPNSYANGVYDCVVEWVPVGTRFFIKEYDGSEELVIISHEYGYIA